MVVLIDTREQTPWEFPEYVDTLRVGMKTGDYTLEGYRDSVRIERKSLGDLTNCIGDKELRRYCGQLQRLRKYPFRCVIVESTVSGLLDGRYRSPLPPDEAFKRIMDSCLRFRIPLFFSDNAKIAAIVGLRFLQSAAIQCDNDSA